MGRHDRLIQRILSGQADAAIAFRGLCSLLHGLGFDTRVSGSHHIFRKEGVEEKINLRREGKNAKPYQVRQVRQLILKYKLGGKD